MMKPTFSRPTLVCAAYFCLHVAAQLSARLFEISPGISIWYPPCGLALSLLVMLGGRYAWVVFAANIAGALVVPGIPTWWAPVVFPLIITANYTLVAWFVRRFLGKQLLPGTTAQTVTLAGVLVAAPVGVATVGTLLYVAMFGVPATGLLTEMTTWWLGDVCGLLTIVPAAMVFVAPWVEHRPHPAQRWEWSVRFVTPVALQAVALVGAVAFVFLEHNVLPYGALYFCFLPLIWTSLRHGLPGATLAALVVIMGTMIGIHFFPQTPHGALLDMLLFILTVSVLGLGLGSAVTRRNEAVAELSSSRARFDRVISGAQLGLWDWNVATGDVAYNDRCAELLHQPGTPLADRREAWDTSIHPLDRVRVTEALDAHLQGKSALYEVEYRIHTKDRRWRWIHSRGSVAKRTENGTPLLVSGTHLDVTERKLAEGAAKRLLTIVETTTDYVLTIDSHGHVIYANPALMRLLGGPAQPPLQGRSFAAIFPPRSADFLQTEVIPSALAKGTWSGELILSDNTRREIPTSFIVMLHRDAEDEGSLLSFVMRDISAQKEAEAANLEEERRILQVQKAESLSILAGGIAHDFNNLLTAIFGNAALLREQLVAADPNHQPLSQIEVAASRASELCKDMLAYAGRFHVAMAEVNLNGVVAESRELIQAAISKKIRIETELANGLPAVKGSTSQLQQVIINLALNANDAIGDKPGTIRLRTTRLQIDGETRAKAADSGALIPGSYVVLEVSDTGCGISGEVKTKIFEPYFTTKSNGHGLGLAAVNGIIRAHHGAIQVESKPNDGSTFRIFLPAVVTDAGGGSAGQVAGYNWHGSGLAMVVDDEEMVRTVVAKLVERLGFQVIVAGDGVEAVSLFQKEHRNLQFVLTDLTMPRMSGDEAMTEMRRIDPAVPVILMSGYPEKMAADHFALVSPSALLVKPLRLQVLRKTISQIVGARSDPAGPVSAG